jgi:preprotein translocase subunit SecG
MINTVFLVLHIIFVAIMIGLILLQKSEGGGLGMGGGNFMSARGTANLLTRSTAVMATLFFISTLALAISFKGSKSSASILDKPVAAKTVEAPIAPAKDTSKPSLPVTPNTVDKPIEAPAAQ